VVCRGEKAWSGDSAVKPWCREGEGERRAFLPNPLPEDEDGEKPSSVRLFEYTLSRLSPLLWPLRMFIFGLACCCSP